MNTRSIRSCGCIALGGLALLAGCGSSHRGGASATDGPKPADATATADFPAAIDVPIEKQAQDSPALFDAGVDTAGGDAPLAGTDRPVAIDTPVQSVDAPTSVDGPAELDAGYVSLPDGRQLMIVDFCLPILPLASGVRYCPATLDEAKLAVNIALDGGVVDASYSPYGLPGNLIPCAEPVVVYLPEGWFSTAGCYYNTSSGQLLSITIGWDTPTECVDSPIPNTAAWIAHVYGQHVTCTWPGADGG